MPAQACFSEAAVAFIVVVSLLSDLHEIMPAPRTPDAAAATMNPISRFTIELLVNDRVLGSNNGARYTAGHPAGREISESTGPLDAGVSGDSRPSDSAASAEF